MNSRQLYFRLLRYVKPYWKRLALSVAMLVLLAATEPIFPALMKPLLDEGFTNQNEVFIKWIPIAMVILFLIRGILSFTSSYASSWVANRVVTDLRKEMFSCLVRLPTAYFDQHSSGKLGSKIAYDVGGVTGAATQALTVIVRDSLTLLGLMGWLLWLDWKLATITLALFPLMAIIVRYFNKRLRSLSSQSQIAMAQITHSIEEAAVNNKVVKIFNAENFESTEFASVNERLRGILMRATVASSAVTPLIQLLASLSVAVIVGIALNLPSDGTASAGGFMSFLTALLMLLQPIKRLTDITSTIQRGLAAAESVFELIDEPSERISGDKLISEYFSGEIEFKSVTFNYPYGEKPALKNLNINITSGQKLALVGKSGSGKTTITNLLSGFYTDFDGDILLGGISIHKLKLNEIRQQVSLVSQDVRLFDNTIAANVSYGESEPRNEERIISALKSAHAWEFIEHTKDGINTLIGQNGVKLSGGQRQRLAIARAFYKNAPILILDEATSALDTESERNIQEALKTLMNDRTTIIIAHRLSTIEHADHIVVMESGTIVEQGSHNELIHQDGLYAHYHRLQFTETIDSL